MEKHFNQNIVSKRWMKSFTLGLLTTCSVMVFASNVAATDLSFIEKALNEKTYGSTGDESGNVAYKYYAFVEEDGKLVFKEVFEADESNIKFAYKNEYGSGSPTQYFKWVVDENTGNATLVKVEDSASGYDVVFNGESLARKNETLSGEVNGDFVGQQYVNNSDKAHGGAIFNNGGTVTAINSNFIGNFVETGSSSSASGGAIRNNSNTSDKTEPSIGEINGNFIGNYAVSQNNTYGGAIGSNAGSIGAINGSFIGNYVKGIYEVHGGAIRNLNQTISEINGSFVGNYASFTGTKLDTKLSVSGGAIHNYSESLNNESRIDKIVGDFIGNYVEGAQLAGGGAIFNQAGMIEKNVGSDKSKVSGNSVIGSIEGNFIGNHAIATPISDSSGNSSAGGDASAGAIRNFGGEIGSITGDFIGNYVIGGDSVFAGAIRNNPNDAGKFDGTTQIGSIGNIKGNFIGNYVSGQNKVHGGAIVNTAKIGDIEGSFKGNYATGLYDVLGGAIRNTDGSEIGVITGDFEANHITASSAPSEEKANYRTGVFGGAINNENATIKEIKGKFESNYAEALEGSGNEARGGAIWNYYKASTGGTDAGDLSVAKIGKITGDFTSNYVSGDTYGLGGAIFNTGYLGEIVGNFNGNHADGNSAGLGGAIYNSGKIEAISGSFTGNHASDNGGAIYTTTDLDIVADGKDIEFTGNFVGDENDNNYQAIYVEVVSTDSDVTEGEGEENEALGVDASEAQTNAPTITLTATKGGSITFNDKIEGDEGYNLHLTGDNADSNIVLNNYVNNANVVLDNVTLNIGLTDTTALSSDVFANSVLTVNSGVVSTIDNSYGTYNFKQLISEGGVYSIEAALVNGEAKNDVLNVGENSSGVITLSNFVFNEFGKWDENDNKYVGGVASKAENEKTYIFRILEGTNNVKLAFEDTLRTVAEASANMTSDDILASGFELYVSDTDNRAADEYDSVKVVGWRDNLAAWAELGDADDKTFTINKGDTQVLTRKVKGLNGKNFTIKGESANVLNLKGFNLLAEIDSEQEVALTNIKLVDAGEINNEGSLKLTDVQLEDALVINNDNELTISGKMDVNNTITSDEGGTLNISGANTNITGVVKNQNVVNTDSINNLRNFAGFENNSLLMNSGEFNVFNLGLSDLKLTNLTINGGAINIDSVKADLTNEKMGRIVADGYGNDWRLVAEDDGTINLEDVDIVSNDKGLITDILFADAPVADKVQLGVSEASGPIFNYDVSYIINEDSGDGYVRFERGDYNSSIPATGVEELAAGYATMMQTLEYAFEHADRYSALSHNDKLSKLCFPNCATYKGELPSYYNAYGARGMWIRPYAASEDISLKHGPKVNSNIYGTLIGVDSDLKRLDNGMLTASTVYVGYNGTKQKYDGNRTKQYGGVIGATQTLYAGKLYTALTASGGISSADTNTMFGKDHFRLKMGGVASKTGYNVDFENGRYIVQPNMLASYTLINAGNYTAASTARIKSKNLDVLQLHPHVKLINNMEDGWQAYLLGGMVYNIGKTDITANDIELPSLSLKPYAEYGGGVQVIWDDSITAYGQLLLHSGGKSGVLGTAGLRWNF